MNCNENVNFHTDALGREPYGSLFIWMYNMCCFTAKIIPYFPRVVHILWRIGPLIYRSAKLFVSVKWNIIIVYLNP